MCISYEQCLYFLHKNILYRSEFWNIKLVLISNVSWYKKKKKSKILCRKNFISYFTLQSFRTFLMVQAVPKYVKFFMLFQNMNGLFFFQKCFSLKKKSCFWQVLWCNPYTDIRRFCLNEFLIRKLIYEHLIYILGGSARYKLHSPTTV